MFNGLGGKGKDVEGLLKNSVTLLGKDSDVFKPAVYMTILRSLRVCAVYFAIYSFFVSHESGKGALTILAIIILSPIISYMNMRYKAITSWMVYDILRGKDTDVSKGAGQLKGLGLSILLYTVVDKMVSSAQSNGEKENGVFELIKSGALSFLNEVWELAKNFSLPAIVIEKLPLKEVPTQLKLMKKNIPAALIGTIGMDFIGSLLVSLMGFVYLPAFILGGVIAYFGKDWFPAEWLMTLPLKTPQTLNMLPLFCIFVVASIFGTAADSLKELVKTAYFTVFYVSIAKPNEIIQSMKGEITHYLDFNDRLDGYTFFKAKTSPEESYDLDESTGEDLKMIKKLANTFATNIVKGLSEQKIYSALIKKGYTEAQVDGGLKNYRQKKSA